MNKIVKGDEVVVIAGRDKGRRGKIKAVLSNNKALVENINIVKRHTKPNPNSGVAGGIVEKEAPIQLSNLMVFNPESGQAERVGIKVLEGGEKARFFKKSGNIIGG
ncbi:MAG TPA: 50S ribosomal protein L24 [Gammaproteobacteria bacterium]|nr:50S ribosomal protein L24 [Gammaproteobacteria bacterium]